MKDESFLIVFLCIFVPVVMAYHYNNSLEGEGQFIEFIWKGDK